MLERARIRAQTKALLLGNTAAGPRVYTSRVTGLTRKQLPAVLIYTPTENGAARGNHLPAFNTTCTLAIEARVAQADGYDDALDAMCEEIEALTLGNSAFVKEFTGFGGYRTRTGFSEGGDVPFALAIMEIDCQYENIFDPAENPDLPAFKTLDLRVDPSEPDTGEIHADVSLQQ